jgi:hypothetical protein
VSASSRTSRAGSLPERLRWLDEGSRADHGFLLPSDHCLYLGEFHARAGWSAGPTNDLIADFKRMPSRIAASAQPLAVQYFKDRAIATVAQVLRAQFGRAAIETQLTFVPIPASKLPGEADYCDRLLRTLRLAFFGLEADIRPLLRQRASVAADHRSGARRIRFGELLELTELDPIELHEPLRPLVVLFDDVLTSGKHVCVAKARIREVFPEQAIIAVLIARRAPAPATMQGPPG